MNIRFGNMFYGWGAAIKSVLVELSSWTWKKWVANILALIGRIIGLSLVAWFLWLTCVTIIKYSPFFLGVLMFFGGGLVILVAFIILMAIAVWVKQNK